MKTVLTNTLQITDTLQHYTQSVFEGHGLRPVHQSPIFNNSVTSYWPGIVLFVILTLYISIRISDPKKIVRVFVSVFNFQVARQLFREDYKPGKRVSLLLSAAFVLVMAFLLHITNSYFGLILAEVGSFYQYLFFVVLLLGMYILKFIVNYLLSIVTSSTEMMREYTFSVFVFCQTAAMILFPVVICLKYTRYPAEWFLYPGIIVCGIFYLLRTIRGYMISVQEQNVGILYIFLYFCALEILPLLILIKFLLINF